MAQPLTSIHVGVVVERRKAASAWIDHIWQPVLVLAGEPETAPWTMLKEEDGIATFYAGAARIDLYRTEAGNYRDNLASGAPSVWVSLEPLRGDPPFQISGVTADPSEGEAWVVIDGQIVEPVPMPESVREAVAWFVEENYVEQAFVKRRRDRADPEALARREPRRKG